MYVFGLSLAINIVLPLLRHLNRYQTPTSHHLAEVQTANILSLDCETTKMILHEFRAHRKRALPTLQGSFRPSESDDIVSFVSKQSVVEAPIRPRGCFETGLPSLLLRTFFLVIDVDFLRRRFISFTRLNSIFSAHRLFLCTISSQEGQIWSRLCWCLLFERLRRKNLGGEEKR